MHEQQRYFILHRRHKNAKLLKKKPIPDTINLIQNKKIWQKFLKPILNNAIGNTVIQRIKRIFAEKDQSIR